LNGILTYAEVWSTIRSKNVDVLENIALSLLKKVLNAQSMTAKDAFFLEAGLMPIKYVISKRRLIYLWNILHREDKELLKRFYLAQQVVKTKNEWAELVERDKSEMVINLSDSERAKLKESKLKSIVEKALEYLNTTADNHSKSRILIKSKIEREKYCDDERFSRSEVSSSLL
jgi:hypothetical protein